MWAQGCLGSVATVYPPYPPHKMSTHERLLQRASGLQEWQLRMKRIKQARGIVYEILKSIDSWLIHHNHGERDNLPASPCLHEDQCKVGSAWHATPRSPPLQTSSAWRGCASHNPSRMRKKTLACQCTPYLTSSLSKPSPTSRGCNQKSTF